MKMIELTNNIDNNKIYINTDKIESMCVDGDRTTIDVGTGCYEVKETPEEILNKISHNEMNTLYDIREIISDKLDELYASIK